MNLSTQKAPIKFMFIVLACLLSADALSEELPIKKRSRVIPEEVELYSREVNNISNSLNVNEGVENLLVLGRKASDALIRPPRGDNDNVLERLSGEEFQQVVLKMKGFFVNREEAYYVQPDPNFFITLAKRIGDQASVEFFEGYNKTIPNTWPVYIEQQTDYSGCIRFGTMSLVDTYARWDAYSKKYPTRYPKEVMNFIRNVEDDLSDGTCSCNDKKSAVQEFNAYIQAFPRAKIAARLHERVDQIQQGKSDIR